MSVRRSCYGPIAVDCRWGGMSSSESGLVGGNSYEALETALALPELIHQQYRPSCLAPAMTTRPNVASRAA